MLVDLFLYPSILYNARQMRMGAVYFNSVDWAVRLCICTYGAFVMFAAVKIYTAPYLYTIQQAICLVIFIFLIN